MKRTTVEIFTEDLCFSAGHFTIFSSSERERLHGHDYQIHAALTTLIDKTGIRFDYRHYYEKLLKIAAELDSYFLLPQYSPYLKLETTASQILAHFNGEVIPFLKADCKILPISNTTVEELSDWILQRLVADKEDLKLNFIQAIEIKISASPGKCANAIWELQAENND